MASRLLFPADRTAFQYTAPGQPILVPPISAITVYTNKGATVLADIRRLDGAAIANSTVYTDEAGLLPEFFGPDATSTRLWAVPLVQGRNVMPYPLDANYGTRIDALSAQVNSIPIPGGGTSGGGANTVLHGDAPPAGYDGMDGDFYIDDLGWKIYGPKANGIWPQGVSLIGPPGPPAPATSGAYTHSQFAPDTLWDITHPLPFVPSVTVVDSSGAVVTGDVQVLSPSHLQVRFSAPFSGSAFLS